MDCVELIWRRNAVFISTNYCSCQIGSTSHYALACCINVLCMFICQRCNLRELSTITDQYYHKTFRIWAFFSWWIDKKIDELISVFVIFTWCFVFELKCERKTILAISTVLSRSLEFDLRVLKKSNYSQRAKTKVFARLSVANVVWEKKSFHFIRQR